MPQGTEVRALSFSPDSRVLLIGHSSGISLYELVRKSIDYNLDGLFGNNS